MGTAESDKAEIRVLLARAQAGDERAFRALVEPYRRLCRSIATGCSVRRLWATLRIEANIRRLSPSSNSAESWRPG